MEVRINPNKQLHNDYVSSFYTHNYFLSTSRLDCTRIQRAMYLDWVYMLHVMTSNTLYITSKIKLYTLGLRSVNKCNEIIAVGLNYLR